MTGLDRDFDRIASKKHKGSNKVNEHPARIPSGGQPFPICLLDASPSCRDAGCHQARYPQQEKEHNDGRGKYPPAPAQVRLPRQEPFRGEKKVHREQEGSQHKIDLLHPGVRISYHHGHDTGCHAVEREDVGGEIDHHVCLVQYHFSSRFGRYVELVDLPEEQLGKYEVGEFVSPKVQTLRLAQEEMHQRVGQGSSEYDPSFLTGCQYPDRQGERIQENSVDEQKGYTEEGEKKYSHERTRNGEKPLLFRLVEWRIIFRNMWVYKEESICYFP